MKKETQNYQMTRIVSVMILLFLLSGCATDYQRVADPATTPAATHAQDIPAASPTVPPPTTTSRIPSRTPTRTPSPRPTLTATSSLALPEDLFLIVGYNWHKMLAIYDIQNNQTKTIEFQNDVELSQPEAYDLVGPSATGCEVILAGDDIIWLDLEGKVTRRIPLANEGQDVYHVTVSPDEKWITYSIATKYDDGGMEKYPLEMDLYIQGIDPPSQARRLSSTKKALYRPDWSPDGQWIAFADADENGQQQLFIIRPDSSEKKQVTHLTQSAPFYIKWSPDNSKIAFFYCPTDGCYQNILVVVDTKTKEYSFQGLNDESLGYATDYLWWDEYHLILQGDQILSLDITNGTVVVVDKGNSFFRISRLNATDLIVSIQNRDFVFYNLRTHESRQIIIPKIYAKAIKNYYLPVVGGEKCSPR